MWIDGASATRVASRGTGPRPPSLRQQFLAQFNAVAEVTQIDPVLYETAEMGTMKGTMGTQSVCPGQAAEVSRHANDVHLLAVRT